MRPGGHSHSCQIGGGKEGIAKVSWMKRRGPSRLRQAPIAGKVIRKYLQKGEMRNKEYQPYFAAIADVEKARINAEVDAYPGRTYKGIVGEVYDYAGARKLLIKVAHHSVPGIWLCAGCCCFKVA